MPRYDHRGGSKAPLIAVGLIILLAVVAVVVFILMNIGENGLAERSVETEAEQDKVAVEGMIDGKRYTGEQNPEGLFSYQINSVIELTDGEGDFLIENPAKNNYLMRASFVVDGRVVYESGFIFPNHHIERDSLDESLEPGEYTAEVTFEAFVPETLESAGSCGAQITLIVK